eukprot:2672728-Pleurochrysis_carterae.AAC.1
MATKAKLRGPLAVKGIMPADALRVAVVSLEWFVPLFANGGLSFRLCNESSAARAGVKRALLFTRFQLGENI